jgi:hypothetical protein
MAEPPKPIPASELEAKEFYKRLFTQIRAFEANHLEHKQELYLTTPNAPGLRIFEIGKHGEAFYLARNRLRTSSCNGDPTLHTVKRGPNRCSAAERREAPTDRILG